MASDLAVPPEGPPEDLLFQRQLEASVDGILCVRADGHILYHNARFLDLWGVDSQGYKGTGGEELTRVLSEKLLEPDGFLAKIQSLHEHPERISRDEVHLRDGRVFDRYSAPINSSTGTNVARVWFFRDITQRKRTEEELRAANERLRELNAMKNQFVNTAAHELATPITPMAMQIQLLLQGQLGSLTPAQRKALDLLDRNMNRLNVLMKDIVDAADVQSDRVTLRHEALRLDTMLRDLVTEYAEPLKQSQMEFGVELEDDLWVRGDTQRLPQVVRALLDNALKFTPAAGRITLRAYAENDQVVVQVQDTGIGLRAEDFRRIFQPFSQVHDTMQKTQSGRGLGLVIAQGIVELHGGRMWCDSPGPNRGSTFSFSLAKAGSAVIPDGAQTRQKPKKTGVWPFIHFRCPVCESRDINMRLIKNKYECLACKHQWR